MSKKNNTINKSKNNKSKNIDNVDSSEISDIDENQSIPDAFEYDRKKIETEDDIDKEAKEEYVKTVVLDSVIKYIKIDDIIKKKQNEHKKELVPIKESKIKLESFLINYLDKIDEEFIMVGTKNTLTKTEVSKKTPVKLEDITESLIEGFKKYELYDDNEDEKIKIIKDLVQTIDSKREVKTRKYLKRTQKCEKNGQINVKKIQGGKLTKKIKNNNDKNT